MLWHSVKLNQFQWFLYCTWLGLAFPASLVGPKPVIMPLLPRIHSPYIVPWSNLVISHSLKAFFFLSPPTLCSLAQGKELRISVEATGSSLSVPYFWNWMCSVDTNCSFCFNLMEKVWRHNNRGIGKGYMQSPVFCMFVVASLQNWCTVREVWYTPIKYLRELALRHRQVGCWWRKLRIKLRLRYRSHPDFHRERSAV